MNILLDTQTAIWTVYKPDRIPVNVQSMLYLEENRLFFSIITLWEIELKHSLHPEDLSVTSKDFFELLSRSKIKMLNLETDHIENLSSLRKRKDTPPHKDPFDRLLMAQAKTEKMRFLTADKKLQFYDEPTVYFYKHM